MIDCKAHITELLIVNVFDDDDGLPARNHFHKRRRPRFDDGAVAYFNEFVEVIDKAEYVQIEFGIRTSQKFERIFKRSVAPAYDCDRKLRTVQHALFNDFDRAGKPFSAPDEQYDFFVVSKTVLRFHRCNFVFRRQRHKILFVHQKRNNGDVLFGHTADFDGLPLCLFRKDKKFLIVFVKPRVRQRKRIGNHDRKIDLFGNLPERRFNKGREGKVKRYDIGRLLFADDAAEIARRVKAQRQHEHRLTPAVLRHVVDERKSAVNVIRRVIISLFEHQVSEKIILIETVEHFDFDVGIFFF